MQYQTKLHILVLISFIFYFSSCKPIIKIQVIKGQIIDNNYSYNNNDGFINSPYGKINIKTLSYYTNKKLDKIEKNTVNGFIEYSGKDLSRDIKLIKEYDIDTIYNENKTYKEKKISNDSTFLKLKNDEVIIYIK